MASGGEGMGFHLASQTGLTDGVFLRAVKLHASHHLLGDKVADTLVIMVAQGTMPECQI